MLIRILDDLLSGRPVKRIITTDNEYVCDNGLTVDWHDCDRNADAWVCLDADGIWLSGNASSRNSASMQGFEEPVANIRRVDFV